MTTKVALYCPHAVQLRTVSDYPRRGTGVDWAREAAVSVVCAQGECQSTVRWDSFTTEINNKN
ncbi:MAG: hypothetical protein RLZZ344_1129 [Pseudomonadota bacterium]|jgi:hypothetical protein